MSRMLKNNAGVKKHSGLKTILFFREVSFLATAKCIVCLIWPQPVHTRRLKSWGCGSDMLEHLMAHQKIEKAC